MSFGWSAGDIANAIAFIVKVIDALDSASGATAEYREAVIFLRDLQHTLEPLHTFAALNVYATYGESIRKEVLGIRGPIEEFLHTVEKFERSLGVDGKKGHHRNIYKKLEWHFSVSKDLEKLRKRVGDHLVVVDKLLQRLTIDMLWVVQQNLSQENLHKAFREVLNPELVTALQDPIRLLEQEMQSCHANDTQQHDAVLSKLDDQRLRIEDILGILKRDSEISIPIPLQSRSVDVMESSKLFSSVPTRENNCVTDNKRSSCKVRTEINHLRVINETLREVYYMALLSLGYFLRNLFLALARRAQPARALTQTLLPKHNISFHDAIGRPVRVLQYDIFIRYKIFRAFVEESFSDTPGSQWVMCGLYKLLNARTGKPFTEDTWSRMISPGTTILMSMILDERFSKVSKGSGNNCPSPDCHGTLDGKAGALWMQCSKCEAEVSEFDVESSKDHKRLTIPAPSLEWGKTTSRSESSLRTEKETPQETPQGGFLNVEDILSFKRIAQSRRSPRNPTLDKQRAKVSKAAIQLSFNIRTSSTVNTIHLLGSWDNYCGQLPLAKDRVSTKAGAWKGTFRFHNGTLQAGKRYWYYYIVDGYHVSHNPTQASITERTTGRILNILDVPSDGISSKSSPSSRSSSKSSSHSSSNLSFSRGGHQVIATDIPMGCSLPVSQIHSPKPISHPAKTILDAEYDNFDATSGTNIISNMNETAIDEDGSDYESLQSSASSLLSSHLGSGLSRVISLSSGFTGFTCSCERYGITRGGDRVRLDCGGCRCGYSDEFSEVSDIE